MSSAAPEPEVGFDIDGDGATSPWEAHLCKICLTAALALAFGKEALTLL